MPATTYTLLIGPAPAPPFVVEAVQGVEVEASTEMASVFRLRLGITQTLIGDWSLLTEDLFRPLVPLSVRVQAGLGPPEALINGYAVRQEVTYGDGPGGSSLVVTGMDATVLMNLQEKVMPWPSMPDSAIAAAVFGQYAVVPQVQPTPPYLTEPEGTTMQRGTDIRFLRRLAARNGYDCYVQPEPLTGIDMGYFRPPQTAGVPQAVVSVSLGTETNVSEFRVRYEMLRPTTAVAAGLDVATKSPQPALAPASIQPPLGLEPSLLRILPPPVVRPADTGAGRNPEVASVAQAIVERSSWAVVAEGRAGPDVGVLRPGGIVNVRGAGRVYSGSYYLTRVHHAIGPDGYVQRFEARRNAVAMTGAELYVEVP